MTVTHILLVLAGWTTLSIGMGLLLGSIMKRCAAFDGVAPVGNEGPLRKSA